MLCENTTPKKTAYNAYRNANSRVRRAEGLKMYALKDAYRMHTSAYKHIKRDKRGLFFLLLLYIACSSIFYCSRLRAFLDESWIKKLHCLSLRTVGFYGLSSPVWRAVRHHPDPFLASRSSHVSAGVYAIPFRRLHCLDGRPKKLYALYASKNRLCMLCENTTPKKTAYNAYRNANRRVRRAEGLKMYALKDAYRMHTKCIQSAYKHIKSRKRGISLLLLLYCPFFYLLLSAISGIHLLLLVSSGIHGLHQASLPVYPD